MTGPGESFIKALDLGGSVEENASQVVRRGRSSRSVELDLVADWHGTVDSVASEIPVESRGQRTELPRKGKGIA